jgi:hypothetical protein
MKFSQAHLVSYWSRNLKPCSIFEFRIMAMNRIQFQPGLSMPEVFELFGSEALCSAALESARLARWFWQNPKFALP